MRIISYVTFFFQVYSSSTSKPDKVTGKIFAWFSSAHALGAFCGSVSTQLKLKKSEGHFFKEAQAAPLHERGLAALSDKTICYLREKKGHSDKIPE